MTLGGRVAEEVFFGRITTGAQDDLQKITKMAFEVCANYGMNPDIGPISYGNKEQQGESFQKPFSEATAQRLDEAVRNMVNEAHRRTTELLTEKKEAVEKVAQLLLEKEVITREDMRMLLGPRPFETNDEVSSGCVSLGTSGYERRLTGRWISISRSSWTRRRNRQQHRELQYTRYMSDGPDKIS